MSDKKPTLGCEMELSTDAEKIEKALRLCISSKNRCNSCPYVKEHNCNLSMIKDAMKLLKRKQQIVRCKDCKHRPKEPDWETYESGFDLEFPEGSKCPCRCSGDKWYSWYPNDDWFCADGERKEGR